MLERLMHRQSLFGASIDMAQNSLRVATMRHEVIANNLANIDTPHYKRKSLTFEAELNRVLREHRKFPKYNLKTSDARHIPNTPTKFLDDVRPRIVQEFDTNYRNDKNNVDIEKEMGDLNKNALHYNAVSASIRSSLARLKTAVTA